MMMIMMIADIFEQWWTAVITVDEQLCSTLLYQLSVAALTRYHHHHLDLDLEHSRQTRNVGYDVDERRRRTNAGYSWSSRW